MNIKKPAVCPIISAIVVALLCSANTGFAQSGNFIQVWGGPQYVGIENFSDYSATNLSGQQNIVPTYRVAAGLDYIHNFNTSYGVQTGLYYSGVGQKYNGMVSNYYNSYSTNDSISYKSQVTMDYIRVPFLLRFNSELDDKDKINLSIYMGFQLGYLLDVKSNTSYSYSSDSAIRAFQASDPNFKLRSLYNNFDFGITAGAQFNIKIKDWEYAHIGVRFDRSITNIENTNYILPNNAPVEYEYPVSTKKVNSVSHDDVLAGYASQYVALNVYVGMSFRTKKIITPPHVIKDDDNNPQE